MDSLIDRKYCINNPGIIIRLFGAAAFLKVLMIPGYDLLKNSLKVYARRGIVMPGPLGKAYKISALIEFRVARIYGKLADLFSDIPEIHSFFLKLKKEEEDHGRLMLLALFHVRAESERPYSPSIGDPEIKRHLVYLRSLEKNLESLNIVEALKLTVALESGETNIIFEKLLSQVMAPEFALFKEEIRKIAHHSYSVPREIFELKKKLGI